MECKACGRDLAEQEFKMVAEWPFCLDCFRKLLEKPSPADEPTAKSDADTNPIRNPETVKPETFLCQLCGKEIDGDRYKKVGIWVFCPDCHIDLNPRPKPPPPLQPDKEIEQPETGTPPHLRFQVKYVQRVNCAGCGKRIPEGGSKEVNQKPYCPDCYYALPREEQEPDEPPETADSVASEAQAGEPDDVKIGPGCESCGKQVPITSIQSVEGFLICRACLSADAELAVNLARARHQKRMQRIKEELGP